MHGGTHMKCIKCVKTGKVTRVKNNVADEMVKSGEFVFVSKSEWRQK
jgi:hypothetical protein